MSKDGEIKLWALSDIRLISKVKLSDEARVSMFVEKEENCLSQKEGALGTFGSGIFTILIISKYYLRDLPDFTNVIKVSPDSQHIAFVNRYTFNFTVLELRRNKYEKSFESSSHKGMIINLEFSFDDNHILTACQDGRARIFDVRSKALKYNPLKYGFFFKSPICFSPDGKMFATSTGIGTDALKPMVWDVETGELLHELSHFSGVMDMIFTPDSKYLITGSRDKTTKVWDTKSGKT